ncbi:hypothetical protein OOT46_01625 [Aquabacterium sp. A7-Y]|uniref:hypothetical protein n=1 Tax=Aquabacterium sp. A7-Y TaxID=1349605 RepID=UPI00223DFB50|nr:hypothetical protein [Aquabacterium sp. A7-Y]MCW7536556.1 hypothetical protein [Aquabacterium sp. A7-Y]
MPPTVHFDPPLVIRKPRPAGSRARERFFAYSGSIAGLLEMQRSEIDTYEAVDAAHGGELRRLPYEHGWLLDFRRLFKGRQRWVVYGREGRLYIDLGAEMHGIGPSRLSFRVQRFGCLLRVSIHRGSSRRVERFWAWFPFGRLLLRDAGVSGDACEPLCELFKEIAVPGGRSLWAIRWSSGVAHRDSGLSLLPQRTRAA